MDVQTASNIICPRELVGALLRAQLWPPRLLLCGPPRTHAPLRLPRTLWTALLCRRPPRCACDPRRVDLLQRSRQICWSGSEAPLPPPPDPAEDWPPWTPPPPLVPPLGVIAPEPTEHIDRRRSAQTEAHQCQSATQLLHAGASSELRQTDRMIVILLHWSRCASSSSSSSGRNTPALQNKQQTHGNNKA